ncbi:MAG: DUF1735 domain-containing protein [Niabella sp.]
MFVACLLFLGACKDAKKDFLTDSKVYLVHSGVQQLQMYDKGDNTAYPYMLDLYKSGALKSGATAKIGVMSEAELVAYNEANGTSYTLLGQDAYNIENVEVSFSDNVKDVNRLIKIDFYPGKIEPALKNRVLPIKIISSSIDINEGKSVVIINPQTHLPKFNIESPQTKSVNYNKGEQIVLDFDIPVALDIDDNATDVNLEMEIDQDYIDRYNQEHGEDYIIPESNMFSFVNTATLKVGEKQISFNVKIFQQYLEKNYMLPIRIKSSSKYAVNQEQYYVIQLNALAQLLPRTNWSIAGFSSQEANGEGPNNGRAIFAIDGNNSTFWHSQWAGSKPQPALVDYRHGRNPDAYINLIASSGRRK